MKVIITLAAICIHILADAQDTKTAEPEYMNQLYYYQPASGALSALEKGEVAMKTKAKFGGVGGASTAYVMQGNKSTFRVAAGDQLSFAVKTDNNMMMDISSMIVLYKFDIKSGSRQVVLQSSGFMGKNSNSSQQGIKCHVKKTATGVYLLVPEKPLASGEYAFINTAMPVGGYTSSVSFTAYGFGVGD